MDEIKEIRKHANKEGEGRSSKQDSTMKSPGKCGAELGNRLKQSQVQLSFLLYQS